MGKHVDGQTLRNDGILQEANRTFFHPLGLAAELDVPTGMLRVVDCRHLPEGPKFGPKGKDDQTVDLRPKAEKVSALRESRKAARQEKLGYVEQPLVTDVPAAAPAKA